MEIKRIAVIGAGIMGNGIAQVSSTAGYEVTLIDLSQDYLDKAFLTMRRSLERMVRAQKVDASQIEPILGRIKASTKLEDAASADYVVEAVSEVLDIKKKIFAELDAKCRPEVILASNTSHFSITAIAAATKRPEKVVGMHWFNPPAVMKLIEIVRAIDTSDETIEVTRDLSAKLGKEVVVCKDAEGFLTSRLVTAIFVEAARMYEEGLATKEDIDKAIKLGLNHPMGPLELADFTGLDTAAHVAEGLEEAFGERFKLSTTFRNLVRAGHFGRKTGKGFYNYESK